MNNFNLRVVVAVLWLSNTIINLVQIVLGSMNPRWLEDISNGMVAGFPINEMTIGIFAFSLIIPVLMAFFVLVIKNNKLNKWINFIMLIVLGLMSWLDFIARSPFEIGISNWVVALATNIPLTIALFYCWRLDNKSSGENNFAL